MCTRANKNYDKGIRGGAVLRGEVHHTGAISYYILVLLKINNKK